MAIIFNYNNVEAEFLEKGVKRQKLITPERVNSDNVTTERIYIPSEATLELRIDRDELAWLHLINGSISLHSEKQNYILDHKHFVLLPPDCNTVIKGNDDTVIFKASVKRATRFDPDWNPETIKLDLVNWTREPVLNSEFDARQRIYMLTPNLAGTSAAKGEMILYPPGTEAANHHHEGAEHFQVILRGSATFYLNGKPRKVSKGDTIYIYDNEQHYFINDGKAELVFIEYFVPGKYKTVWAEGAPVCTWHPSGKDINGEIPSRHIESHSSEEAHKLNSI